MDYDMRLTRFSILILLETPIVARISRLFFVVLALCVGLLTLGKPTAAESTPSADQPNIVMILSDDQGWGDFSLNGNRNLQTSNVDSLARQGTRFDRFYVCPVCSPTRAELLTGRYHDRSGVFSTSTGGERLNLDETTIANVFRSAGYATAAFGKWHNGSQYPYHPNGRGFDEFYGFCSGHWGNYYSPMLEHNGRIVRGKGFIIDDLTNKAIEFIEKHRDRSFFVYLPYNTPHAPMQAPEPWWSRFKEKKLWRQKGGNVDHARAALAMCENIDWNVGRLLATLDRLKLADNTIVLYFCDNGPNGVRYNGGMKGRKGSTDEGGVRSPLVIRWPCKIAAGIEIDEIAGAIDLLPTLADLAGIEARTAKPLDGRSLAPLLLGEEANWPDREIYSAWRGRVSVRTQRFRLDHQGRLFDMVQDPGQQHDVAQQFPEIATSLRDHVARWKAQTQPATATPRPFLVGYAEFPLTQLPARDAKPHGAIRRSNPHPNCSYFTNWQSTNDAITWDIDTVTAGDYEARLFYTCPEANVGSTVRLSFQGNHLTGKVSQSHDSPLIGADEDRVPRTEAYVKDWAEMTLGTLHMSKGRGTLKLSAKEIAGAQVMDFRLLLLELKPRSSK